MGAEFAHLPAPLAALMAGAGGSSPYLRGLITAQRDWLETMLQAGPEAAVDAEIDAIAALTMANVNEGLRRAKARVALAVALADLAGLWPLEAVTGALTRLADAALGQGVRLLVAAEAERGKLPAPKDGTGDGFGGYVVLAMGKMGAFELNYSSDIDLICLFDETIYRPDDYGEVRAALIRVTRRLMALLSEPTPAGYVFRTDLRLRPDPAVTPVCLSMEAAERYYESVGRTWERAAHIKARAAAGDIAAGARYLARLTPFIWRKHLDFAAIEDAHDMRLRIRAHKGLAGPLVLEGHDLKLGYGGIREIEFFTQTRQIIAGGRDPDLRARGTVPALAALAQKGWVPPEVAEGLAADYAAHRLVEHRLQMIGDAQTHSLPQTADGLDRLACLMDRAPDALRAELTDRLRRVAAVTEGFFDPGAGRGGETAATAALSEAEQQIVSRWRTYPALRSQRAVEIFKRLLPEILRRLTDAPRPEEALAEFDRFLAGLPAGVQVFSLFDANPQLVDLIADIAATSPALARYLGHNAQVFDAVIGGTFFDPWPGAAGLTADLAGVLAAPGDYERALDAARRWMKEWHFRIGVHHLRGLIDAETAAAQYADIAEAVLAALWPVVVAGFAARHGPPPGRGATVLGMGSLGAARLNAGSDLDLIVIYDAAGIDSSQGPRPLAARAYYARLTQALVTALTAPMPEGRLYEVDMRLRPSGRQGPVATALAAFVDYQEREAWTWEHLALTRARPVAGTPALGADVETFRAGLMAKRRDRPAILEDVRQMRARIAAAKGPGDLWQAKLGAGRMQDIELVAQTGLLLAGSPAHGTGAGLDAAAGIGLITAADAAALAAGHALFWRLQAAARLLTGEALDLQMIGAGGRAFLLRQTGMADIDALTVALDAAATRCAKIVDAALGEGSGAV